MVMVMVQYIAKARVFFFLRCGVLCALCKVDTIVLVRDRLRISDKAMILRMTFLSGPVDFLFFSFFFS